MTELDALDAEVTRLTKERDELRARRRLPMLDRVVTASPCSESWELMRGDVRVRHCGTCDNRVYNLSEMTRAEAEALLEQTSGNVCARYYRRHDGTIMTADCGGTPQLRPRAKGPLAAVIALLGLVFGWLALRKWDRGYSLGSVGIDDRPATLNEVIWERHDDEPQMWRQKPDP